MSVQLRLALRDGGENPRAGPRLRYARTLAGNQRCALDCSILDCRSHSPCGCYCSRCSAKHTSGVTSGVGVRRRDGGDVELGSCRRKRLRCSVCFSSPGSGWERRSCSTHSTRAKGGKLARMRATRKSSSRTKVRAAVQLTCCRVSFCQFFVRLLRRPDSGAMAEGQRAAAGDAGWHCSRQQGAQDGHRDHPRAGKVLIFVESPCNRRVTVGFLLQGSRILRCMSEWLATQNSYLVFCHALVLAKCLEQKMWEDSPRVLQQVRMCARTAAAARPSTTNSSTFTLRT